MDDFEERNIRVVAISVDPVDVNLRHWKKMGFTFPLLADTDAAVIKRYDLLHEHGGPGGANISRPAEFLIDPTGTVRWANLTENAAVRARPDEVLAVFDALDQKRAGEKD